MDPGYTMAKAQKPSRKSKPAPKAKPKPAPKPAAKKAAPAKPVHKPLPAKAAKPTVKAPAPAPKAPAKPVPAAKKPEIKPVKGAEKPAKGAPAKPPEPPAAVDDKKGGRKGITIVQPKPVKRPRVKPSIIPDITLAPVRPISRTPLIPSGAKAAQQVPLGAQGDHQTAERPKAKTVLAKKDLARFRLLLLKKRAELVGDVSTMEEEALRGESGSLSNLPQHIADQGSETYDQALALEIAAADRKLVKEIDDAMKRIDDGTYGMCELTGRPISIPRLEELPWARYSIEAARELERRSMRS
jgi:RNA polymerase-binding protein DksA